VSADLKNEVSLWRNRSALLLVWCVGLLLLISYSAPGYLMASELNDKNEALKQSLAELKKALPTLDKIHQRLQMYDTQLQAIASFETPTTTNIDLIRNNLDQNDVFQHGPLEGVDSGLDALDGPESQVDTWVESILQRIRRLEKHFEAVEPNLNLMVSEMEDLDALRIAMPSRWPILGNHGSPFGWRTNPVTHQRLFHKGVDIAAKQGTPIFSTAPGTVHRAGWMQGYGYAIDIQHGFGLLTRYAHCSRLNVKKGDTLERGALIGWVGQTGRATGPHVHFEIRIGNEPVDPTAFLGH
jgi:murein DD-endopeptidase MepM/ murein hydrolase activator NlpD